MTGVRRRGFLRVAAAATALTSLVGVAGASRGRLDGHPKVVIVGGGFAGASCALALRRLNSAIDVTLVDPDDRYVTCPMSNSVLAGLRTLASITVSRVGLERAGVHVVRDRVSAIDAGRRAARLGGGGRLTYDRLVLAAGIRFLWGEPQGYDEAAAQLMPHAWQAGAQTAILASQLRAMNDGGVVAISVPAGPMRCPPGPFERASLIASYLRQHKPRSKVLIFDANNHFPKQDVFSDAWQNLYPGMIEWVPVVEGGAVVRVAPAAMTLYTAERAHRVDVANIIPPQAPAILAVEAGLASARGWCPINPATFESALIGNVHVIGDACIADPLPKSASAALGQAKQCALAISAAFGGRGAPEPAFESVCYSLLAPDRALSIHGRFRWTDGRLRQLPPPTATGRLADPGVLAAKEAQDAADWYRRIVADSFAVGRRGFRM
jgi:NADPH-dependent 2,4-dienoyl-CoA reductase/sulfur reductase-like enzyme